MPDDDDWPDKSRPIEEPVYEAIGPGALNEPAGENGEGAPPGAQIARAVLGQALEAGLRSVQSGRFWALTAAAFLGSVCCGLVLAIVVVTGGDLPPEALTWAYILTAASLIVVSCVVAVRWTINQAAALKGAERDEGPGASAAGPLLDWAAASGRGAAFAAAAGVFLLVLAYLSGSPPALAGVAAAVILLELLVFGAIAAGASAWSNRTAARFVAWTAAITLLVGNVMAVVALLPAVRSYERVVVAVNIERDEYGRPVSWGCLPESKGLAEVYHTERIVWLAAGNPLVIFALLAGQTEPREDSLAWLPGELQNAAEGSQVPCVEGRERQETGAELPLAAAGVALQLGVAGAFLGGGQFAFGRRSGSGG
ncbi:hypothetical protein [Arthrobacter sp. 754]|uniref:hypothetical protein n=1 Tax=Arthrobacter sp. 754 TaxID=3156315 RepID=UPI003393F70A